MVDLSVQLGRVKLKNPIMPASGCFSPDIANIVDVNRLGAVVAKTVSREYRIGNPPPRVAELECGMINSIGLPTKGIQYLGGDGRRFRGDDARGRGASRCGRDRGEHLLPDA
jgi:dihydroorotate dehydrogenase (NAD+) catalytic subunit